MAEEEQHMGLDEQTREYIRQVVKEATGNTARTILDMAGTVGALANQVQNLYEARATRPINELARVAAMSMVTGRSPGDLDADKVAEKAYEIAVAMYGRGIALEAEERKKAEKPRGQASVPGGRRVSLQANGGRVSVGADGKVITTKEDGDGGRSDHRGQEPPTTPPAD